MLKNISKNSPKIGLTLLIIAIVFDVLNIFEEATGDAAGKGIQNAFQLFFAICLYTPLLILYFISIFRLSNNPNVFNKSTFWTIIHLLPITFFIYAGGSFLDREITSYNNNKEYDKLAEFEKYFENTSDTTKYLIIEQDFVFYVSDRRLWAPNWGPYIETIGKINNNAFETVYAQEKFLSSSQYWDLHQMENKKGHSFFQVYRYNQISYDKKTYMFPKDFYPSLLKLK